MASEAEDRAEGDAQTAAMVQSMTNMMFRCNVCGGTKSHYARDGLCDQCRFVVAQVLAERNGAEVVRDGHTRREYVVAYLEQRPGKEPMMDDHMQTREVPGAQVRRQSRSMDIVRLLREGRLPDVQRGVATST